MKETFFYTVSVLLAFVAFAVFPMNLEADPGSDEKEYEMNRVTSDESGIINTIQTIQKPIHILLKFEECEENTSCVSEKIIVPKGQMLIITHISISAGILQPIDRLHVPQVSLVRRNPEGTGHIFPITIGAMSFSSQYRGGGKTILIINGDNDIHYEDDQSCELYITINTLPNTLDLEYKMTAIISGYLVPVKY